MHKIIKRGRILLVDDNQQWREELSETLHQAGYYVETAATTKEALQKFKDTNFHLIILDLRMEANNQENKDGIQLLYELRKLEAGKETKVIMLSAYNNLPDMRTAFREEVVDVLNKQEFDNDVFVQEIVEIFVKKVKINLNLQIAWQQNVNSAKLVLGLEIGTERIEKNNPQHDALTLELEDLFCRIFYDASSILNRPLTSGNSGTRVISAHPVYQEGGGARPVVVKFGDVQKIEAEYTKFKKYAAPYIGGGRSTTTLAVRYTLHLGGISYSLLGGADDRLKSFGEFYHHATISQIKEMISGLFIKTCGAWYSNPGNQHTFDLSKTYQESLNFTWEKLYTALAGSLKSVQVQEKLTFDALNSARKFTNPITATAGHSAFYTTYTCITHGDFNQNNIFVDSSGHSWLIDFQSTGPGHILRDFVALDTEIRCKLLQPEDATLAERLALEEILCSIDEFQQLDQLLNPFLTQNPLLAKAFESVVHLRKLAYDLIPYNQNDMPEYYAALLYQALNTSRFRTLPTGQCEHALLSACLLIDKLGMGT